MFFLCVLTLYWHIFDDLITYFFVYRTMCTAFWIGGRFGDIFYDVKIKMFLLDTNSTIRHHLIKKNCPSLVCCITALQHISDFDDFSQSTQQKANKAFLP